jgi:NADPH-dependent 2,4-dienoyl-CoA reductase/sulfur reductase-like enzyme
MSSPGTHPEIGRVIVVGGGIGGVSTVAALRAHGYPGELVLLDRSAFPYDRPPLSKEFLAGTRELEQIALQPAEWYADHKVDLITEANVVAVRPELGEVELADGRSFVGDHLVLATGGRAARPPIPGSDSRFVHVLREHGDAERLRGALVAGARLLVVGAGLIGAEAASTARALGCEVVVCDPLDPPLTAAVGADLAGWLHAQHVEHGVETVAGTVQSLQETERGIAAQLSGEPASRDFDAVLLGVGMVPETGLAEAAGLDVDRGILVDRRQVTSHPRVLAVGDSARLRDHARTEHWEAAQQDAGRAAAAILGLDAPGDAAHWFWSDRYHHHIEGVGQMRAADGEHTVVRRGELGRPPFSVWTLRHHTVVGAAAVDDSHAVRAARRLIDRRIQVDAAQLADPTSDLRKLLRG